MLKLYHNDMSTCSQKVRSKFHPKGLVPVLDHDGNIVTESNIIIEHL